MQLLQEDVKIICKMKTPNIWTIFQVNSSTNLYYIVIIVKSLWWIFGLSLDGIDNILPIKHQQFFIDDVWAKLIFGDRSPKKATQQTMDFILDTHWGP